MEDLESVGDSKDSPSLINWLNHFKEAFRRIRVTGLIGNEIIYIFREPWEAVCYRGVRIETARFFLTFFQISSKSK
jgi:hypothetical protein